MDGWPGGGNGTIERVLKEKGTPGRQLQVYLAFFLHFSFQSMISPFLPGLEGITML